MSHAHPAQRRPMLASLLGLSLVAGAARAEEMFTLTDAAFESRSVVVRAIEADALAITTSTGEAQQVPLTSFVQLTRPAKTDAIKGLVLCLRGGERLVGQPKRLNGQSIVWFAAGVGEISVPLDRVQGILRDRLTDPSLLNVRAEDEVKLATGDAVRGVISDLTDKSISVMPAGGGDATPVPMESVTQVMLAAPPGAREAADGPKFVVRLTTGTIIGCSAIKLGESDVVKLVTAYPTAAPSTTQMGQIIAIEHAAGPVTWLSTREPVENVYTPYFTGAFPAQMDRTVTGDPIRINGVTYMRGIGVHSRSKLVFALTPGDRAFRTRYAMDASLSYADVDVRVSVDGKVLHEKKGFRAGVLSDLVQLDLPPDAKTLTLEVDYGQGYDIQDRLTWIEPALVRK